MNIFSPKSIKKGLSLPELLISVSILSVVILATATTQINAYSVTEKNKDRIFAGQKSIQMLDELRSIVNGGEEYKLQDLDSKDDGNNYNPILTTENFPESMNTESRAISSLSKNSKRNNSWKFVRNIDIRRNSIDAKSRDVTVSIFYANPDGTAVKPALAAVSAILKTSSNPNMPMQKLDAYGLAIANESAWWSDLGTLKSSMIDYAYDLSSRNLGLEFKMHYITISSFGRDPYYTPYINRQGYVHNDSNLKYPYFYPGKFVSTGPYQAGTDFYYYPVEEMEQSGMRLNIDGTISNSWPTKPITNSQDLFSFSASDQYNHGVRYPEEININDKFKNLKKLSNSIWEPTYRVFLEKLLSTSDYKDSLISNLHGELLPLIPIRNYSDPAKMPDTSNPDKLSPFRVVTHPEFLNYNLDTNATNKSDTNVVLRVYPFLSDPSITGDTVVDKINVFIPTNNLVGGNESDTLGQVDSTDTMPNFNFKADSSTFQKIRDAITVSYINNDSSGNFERVTSNLKGTFRIKVSSGVPITIRKGTKIIEDGGGFLTFYTTKDIKLTTNNTFVNAEVSGKGWFTSTPTITGVLKLAQDNANSRVINASSNISTTAFTNFTIQNTATPFTLDTTTNAKGKYDITVNPVFDRYGTGEKKPVPGILLTLYNTETKNIQVSSGKGGLPSTRRLYGKEYVPTPLGKDMFPSSSEDTAALKKFPINGSKTYLSYKRELMGRDLDETTDSEIKNTARWIIKLNIGKTDSSNLSPCDLINPDLTCFQNKMMVVETRMSNDMSKDNLTSGLSMNQTVNTKDGNMVSVDSIVNKYRGSAINDSNISIVDVSSFSDVVSSVDNSDWKKQLSNLSRTYTWIGDESLIPYTERFQLVGDPRYNPYIDVLQNNRINLAYTSLNSSTNLTNASHISNHDNWFSCFTGDLTSVDSTLIDSPRFTQLFREGLLNSNAIYNSLTGWSTYYYSLGGEIGNNDSNERFKVLALPYGVTGTKEMNEGATGDDTANDIIEGKGGTRIVARADKGWVSNPWIGELYPDEKFSSSSASDITWSNTGNLLSTTTVNANSFIKLKINELFKGINPDDVNTTAVAFYPNKAQKRFREYGAPMFFNGSAESASRAKTFNHLSKTGSTAKITSIAGNDIVQKYNLPLSETMRVDRPYSLKSSGYTHGLWNHSEYTSTSTILSFIPTLAGDAPQSATDEATVFYYKTPKTDNEAGSAIVRVDAPYKRSSDNKIPSRAYVVSNAMSAQGTESKSILAKYSLVTMLHAFFSAGNSENKTDNVSLANRMVQIPKLALADSTTSLDGWIEGQTPKEGTELSSNSIKIQWNTRWLRWDDKPYTSNYPNNWKESNLSLKYNITYSMDSGKTWKYMQDDQIVKYPGILDESSSHVIDATSTELGQNVFKKDTIWNVASLPDGKYLFKVEGFRVDNITGRTLKNHSSYHQREIILKRN